jgi:uroporphyrinogen-III synthase
MRILLTRPCEDSEPLAERLRRQGHEVVQAPLLEIRLLPDAALDLDGVQALLLTSANGARALPADAAIRVLPVIAVGASTARAARAAGFVHVASADGDVAGLAALVTERLNPAVGALLHVAAGHVAGDLAGRLGEAGFQVRRAILYEAVAAETLPAAAAAALRQGVDAVLFYSPRTALTFAKLATEAGLSRTCGGTEALCLSQAVADAARELDWRAVRVAPQPDQEALLALLDQVETGR